MSLPTVDDPFGVLRRVLRPRERPAPGERCDMCGEVIGDVHSHVADVGDRRLLCTCRGCYLLFTVPGAGGLRMRAVPERYRLVHDLALTERDWQELAVPVDLVFVFRQSDLAGDATRLVACYPSPAGPTESELDHETWARILQASAGTADLADDVEAVLLRRTGPGQFQCLLVPIDACYQLVGVVRVNWIGLQGGAQVWQQIEEFFADCTRRAR
jgi:hypothetical protein